MTNIYNRDIRYNNDCRAKLMDGINGLADAVAVTLGPCGKNVMIKLGYHDPKFTKDGVTVARNVFFSDPFKNAGAEIISNVALRTGMRCGDGTSTSVVLARALLMLPGIIEQSHVTEILSALSDMAISVTGYDDWYNVALVSANGDVEVAKLIADSISAVGMDGQITVEMSPDVGLRSEVVHGMSFQRGYSSPYFVTNADRMVVELDAPDVLVVGTPLYNMEQVFPSLKSAAEAGRSLLIIAPEIDGDALSVLTTNKVRNGARVCAVNAKNLTQEFMEDICVAVGADMTSRSLGSAKKVIVYHDRTIIIEGGGDPSIIESRCEVLRENGKKDRLARLSGGVAVLWVGGHTEAEASERKDRVDDALGATRSAIEEGIVPGGGSALWYASRGLPEGVVKFACEAPIQQILKNAGMDYERVLAGMPQGQGYDARRGEYCDMVKSGVVDPLKVVRSAFGDAVSVATLVANTEAGIVEKPEETVKSPVRSNNNKE